MNEEEKEIFRDICFNLHEIVVELREINNNLKNIQIKLQKDGGLDE